LSHKPARYEIRIEGHLAAHRLQAFEGLAVTHLPHGDTELMGRFTDQSALYGLLNWLQDLGTPLVSVRRLQGTDEDDG